jgi:hypothetical protein
MVGRSTIERFRNALLVEAPKEGVSETVIWFVIGLGLLVQEGFSTNSFFVFSHLRFDVGLSPVSQVCVYGSRRQASRVKIGVSEQTIRRFDPLVIAT